MFGNHFYTEGRIFVSGNFPDKFHKMKLFKLRLIRAIFRKNFVVLNFKFYFSFEKIFKNLICICLKLLQTYFWLFHVHYIISFALFSFNSFFYSLWLFTSPASAGQACFLQASLISKQHL